MNKGIRHDVLLRAATEANLDPATAPAGTLDPWGFAASSQLLGLRGDGDHNLTLEIRDGKLGFDEDIPQVAGAGPDEGHTATSYAFDSAWHHLRWTNRISGPNADVEVLIDGVKIGGVKANAADYDRLVFDLGDCATSDPRATPWRIRYDNVVIVAK